MKKTFNYTLILTAVAMLAFSSCNRLDILGMVVNRSDTEERVADWLDYNAQNGMPILNNIPDDYTFYSCSDIHVNDDNSRFVHYITKERNDSIWSARGAFLEAIKSSTTEMDECDVVVPRSRMAELVRFSHTLQKKHNVRILSFGHAGDGNLHFYVLRDALGEEEWKKTLAAAFGDLYAKARELHGQVSGEHGIGYAKKSYLAESLSPEARALMRGIKAVFDPKGILNPHKVV